MGELHTIVRPASFRPLIIPGGITMAKTKNMFAGESKKSATIEDVGGEQGQMFEREKPNKVNPMEEKEEMIGGKKRKIDSLFS